MGFRSQLLGGPALSLNFTSGALPAGVTFSRSTTGTRFNAAGVIVTEAINAPRFDYDPVTHAANGLLMQESRANYARFSANLADAAWYAKTSGVTPTANTTVAPDGTTTAATLAFDVESYSYQVTSAVPPAEASVFPIWLKGTPGDKVGLRTGNTEGGGATSSLLVTLTSTWTRYVLPLSPNGSSAWDIGFDNRSGVVTGAGAALTLQAWGAQFEPGSYATSDIYTTSSAPITRAADVASFTIPAGVTTIRTTYSDDTTSDVAVTPLATYNIPTGSKAVKSIVSVGA